jgi:hypothetical protein
VVGGPPSHDRTMCVPWPWTVRRALAVGVFPVLFSMTTATSASAHTGEATFEVQRATATNDRSVELRVAVIYRLDGDPAEGAFLQAVPIAPDGRKLPPVAFEREPGGVYSMRTTVDSEGLWAFEVTSRFPPGSTTIDIEVAKDKEVEPPSRAPRGPADEADGDGAGDLLPVLPVGAVALGVVVLLVVRLRRHRQEQHRVGR